MSTWNFKHKSKRAFREKMRRRGKRSAEVAAERRLSRGIDAETARYRALENRRGAVVFVGNWCAGGGDSPIPVEVCHSTSGRTDQFDVILDGRILLTAGGRTVAKMLFRS